MQLRSQVYRKPYSVFEPLARRVLLSAEVVNSILQIVGGEGDDRISVTADPTFVNVLDVDDNGTLHRFALAAVGRISIATLGGNDQVRIDASLDPMRYRSYIDVGAGDDAVTAGAGRDVIIGGDGNDKLRGGDDGGRIDGGAGRDSIFGGNGVDWIVGGSSNDVIRAGAGADQIRAGSGDDLIDC